MPRLNITLDTETHQILHDLAIVDERSLTQYIQRVLRQHAGTLTLPNNTKPQSQPQLVYPAGVRGVDMNQSSTTAIPKIKNKKIKEVKKYE